MKLNLALLNACVVSACMLFTTQTMAEKKYEIAVVAKVTGIPWFTRMEVGVNEAAKKLDVNAYQVGPPRLIQRNKLKSLKTLLPKMWMPSLWCRTMPKCWNPY